MRSKRNKLLKFGSIGHLVRCIVVVALASVISVSLFASTFYLGNVQVSESVIILPLPQSEHVGNSENGTPTRRATPRKIRLAKLKSSVDYMACCGLGHRMSKLVDAHYISHVKKFGLRVFFGFCNETTEVFHHFFGAQPLSELDHVTHQRTALKINNESPCFSKFTRTGNESECKCPRDYMEQSGIFYTSLMERFKGKKEVQKFGERHSFANHTVIGLHVRAGNGEQGDFMKKNRGIHNTSFWIHSMSNILLNISKKWTEKTPLLFVATDTASVVHDFRRELSEKIKVVDYEQERLGDGSGIVFGEAGTGIKPKGEDCLLHWKNTLMDMMLLASTDVVVAGRPSSFTQSLPMSVVLARRKRKTSHTYCEVSPNAEEYRCFEDFHDWCCRGTTELHLQGIRRYEYRRMPAVGFENSCPMDHRLQGRPAHENTLLVSVLRQQSKSAFLPYDWDWVQN